MPDNVESGGHLDEVLQSAPSGTPSWGLGIAFILATCLSPFVAVYLAISPDIRQYLTGKQEIEIASLEANKVLSLKNSESVLAIVASYSQQVETLSSTLGELRSEKRKLEDKVDILGREVESIKKSGEDCARELAVCKSSLPR